VPAVNLSLAAMEGLLNPTSSRRGGGSYDCGASANSDEGGWSASSCDHDYRAISAEGSGSGVVDGDDGEGSGDVEEGGGSGGGDVVRKVEGTKRHGAHQREEGEDEEENGSHYVVYCD
jgi:hypothetical protein